MRHCLTLTLLFCLAIPASATAYFLAPGFAGGSDSNNGLSAGFPWLTPNHALNCGDTITAAASSNYSPAPFISGQWGTVSCPANNNVAWLICATFDGCKFSSSATGCTMQPNASYWGIQ